MKESIALPTVVLLLFLTYWIYPVIKKKLRESKKAKERWHKEAQNYLKTATRKFANGTLPNDCFPPRSVLIQINGPTMKILWHDFVDGKGPKLSEIMNVKIFQEGNAHVKVRNLDKVRINGIALIPSFLLEKEGSVDEYTSCDALKLVELLLRNQALETYFTT